MGTEEGMRVAGTLWQSMEMSRERGMSKHPTAEQGPLSRVGR